MVRILGISPNSLYRIRQRDKRILLLFAKIINYFYPGSLMVQKQTIKYEYTLFLYILVMEPYKYMQVQLFHLLMFAT